MSKVHFSTTSVSAKVELLDDLLCGRHDVHAPHKTGQVHVFGDLLLVEGWVVVLKRRQRRSRYKVGGVQEQALDATFSFIQPVDQRLWLAPSSCGT
jgi:hypothetical protein